MGSRFQGKYQIVEGIFVRQQSLQCLQRNKGDPEAIRGGVKIRRGAQGVNKFRACAYPGNVQLSTFSGGDNFQFIIQAQVIRFIKLVVDLDIHFPFLQGPALQKQHVVDPVLLIRIQKDKAQVDIIFPAGKKDPHICHKTALDAGDSLKILQLFYFCKGQCFDAGKAIGKILVFIKGLL